MYMIKKIDFYNKISYKDRTINFRLKNIFSDHWDNFLKNNSNLNIRPVVLKDFDIVPLTCPNCGNQILWQYRVC